MNAEDTLPVAAPAKPDVNKIIVREALSWLWVILAFLFITGTIVQARVIPSGSMERTLLVGDHLLMSRFGYEAELPMTPLHVRLWREPRTPADHRVSRAASRNAGLHQAPDRAAGRRAGNSRRRGVHQRQGAARNPIARTRRTRPIITDQ